MPGTPAPTIQLEPQTEGGYTVSAPALPEVVTEAETEALAMAEDAIRGVIAYRQAHGIALPEDIAPTPHRIAPHRIAIVA